MRVAQHYVHVLSLSLSLSLARARELPRNWLPQNCPPPPRNGCPNLQPSPARSISLAPSALAHTTQQRKNPNTPLSSKNNNHKFQHTNSNTQIPTHISSNTKMNKNMGTWWVPFSRRTCISTGGWPNHRKPTRKHGLDWVVFETNDNCATVGDCWVVKPIILV